ncbi:MAG: alpha/beta fold hydrolase [Betaproteobacteria bacterium]|nr:alpha/beta fold hydrolase [Betaproteobacteria bacterium]
MRIRIEDAQPGPPDELLVALLTGTLSQPEDFVRERFVQAARDRGVRAEFALVGTPAARVADGTVADVLEQSLWAPARARGRRRLWLAGISLGGLAAMAYAVRYPQAIAGLVLLAPYPGSRDWLRRLDAGGGLASLAGPPREPPDAECDAWSWLANAGSRTDPPTYLLYGKSDRFAEGHARIARALPPAHVDPVEGAHDWPTWRRAWDRFLATRATELGGVRDEAGFAPVSP